MESILFPEGCAFVHSKSTQNNEQLKLNASLEMTHRIESKIEISEQKWECGNKMPFPISVLYPVLISWDCHINAGVKILLLIQQY